jgi:mono/diheme cytochrome c family protein
MRRAEMRKSLFAAIALFAFALPPTSALTQDLKKFKSVSVDIPDGDRLFPGGVDADAINDNCLGCHSAGMVLNQPSFPKAVWEAEIQKMITTYRAPIDQADVARIVAYLAKVKGKD